ncbi:MAG TPA: RDD family protein, partial [Terriglobales bacterium]|nr:RDD family protein [Terriglobales bacterium]
MRNVVVVETNEGVRFTLTLAGPVSRSLAWAIDQTVVILGCILTGKLIGMLPALSPDLKIGLTVLSYFVIWIAYGICLEWKWAGQTIGKRVLKLRVMDGTGRKLVFSQIAIRNLMRFLDALPFLYFVGGLAMLLSDRYQRIGDLVANTIVLRDRQTGLPDFAMAAAN